MDEIPLLFGPLRHAYTWHLTSDRVPLAYGVNAVGWHVVDAEGQVLARAATWTALQATLAAQEAPQRLVWIEVVA